MNKLLTTIFAVIVSVGMAGADQWSDSGTSIVNGTVVNNQYHSNAVFGVVPPDATLEFIWSESKSLVTHSVTIYDATVRAVGTTAIVAAGGSNFVATLTAGDFEPADELLLFDVSAGTYHRFSVNTTNGVAGIYFTNIVNDAAVYTNALAAGDIMYRLDRRFQRIVDANSSASLGGSAGILWKAPSTMPSVVEIADTTLPSITTNLSLIISGNRGNR